MAKAALAAIASGQPQYVSLRPEEVLEAEGLRGGDERDGIRFARNGCPSKGSMDIFVEPVLPQPHLVILGAGPIGCLHVRVARASGANRVFLIDLNEERLVEAQRRFEQLAVSQCAPVLGGREDVGIDPRSLREVRIARRRLDRV